ncbi:MAG: ABC transporter substrate-binding protein [Crenarchaeota archaeon]|nr:ABC transporter substrate-binding protein [Thermoproteota archaeon]
MRLARIIPIIVLAAVALSTVALIANSAVLAQTNYSWIAKVEKVYWFRVPQENVPYALTTGQIDVYLFGIRPEMAAKLAGNPGIKLYSAPSGIVDLILNPAPVMELAYPGKNITKAQAAKLLGIPEIAISQIYWNPKKKASMVDVCIRLTNVPSPFKVAKQAPSNIKINPFCFRQIRFAMNYIVNRQYIVSSVYKGYAIPMYAPYSAADPTYQVIADIVAQFMFTYNPDYANKIITKVLTEVGAKKIGGKWYFEGSPITIPFIIRVEDERKIIGEMVAAELEKLGFIVNRLELTFGPAITKVYTTDPMSFEWMIYTEGWGKGSIDRWDPWTIAQFAAPWFGFMPGWQQPGYWQYRNSTLDKLTEAICLGKVSSKAQWIAYLRKAVLMSLQEAIRIWIATPETIFPTTSKLMGVTLNLGSGLRDEVLNLRNWYVPGRDYINVGHLWIWTSRTVWNNYGGFGDVYSVDPMRATFDPWIWRNPFNGEPMPFRVTYQVKTAGPNGKIPVPPDALTWNPAKGWVPIGSGHYVKSVVIFNLNNMIGKEYHDGQPITWADILGDWALWFDIAYNKTKASMEPSIASTAKWVLQPIVAIKPDFKDNKLYVYINYWFFDPNYIADMAYPTSCENPFIMDLVQQYLAFDLQKYALSETRARSQRIPQLNLVLASQMPDIIKALEALKTDAGYKYAAKFFTVPGQYTLPKDEYFKFIDMAINWIKKYNVAWISDGPFMLVYFNKDTQKLILQRFDYSGYPIKNLDVYFGIPKFTKITSVSVPTINPGASAVITVSVTGEFPITIEYLIMNPSTMKLVLKGNLTTTTPTALIKLTPQETAKLAPFSSYTLIIIAFSSKVAMPAEKVIGITTGMAVSTLKGLTQQVKSTAKKLTSVAANVSKLSSEIATLKSKLSQAVANLSKSIATISSSLSKVSQSLSQALKSQIASVRQALGAQVASTLQQLSSTITASIKSLGSSISSAVAAIKSTLGTMSSTISSISTTVNSLNTKISTLSSEVKSLSSKVSSISSTLSTLSTKIDKLSSEVSSLKSDVSSIHGAVYGALGAAIVALIGAWVAAGFAIMAARKK